MSYPKLMQLAADNNAKRAKLRVEASAQNEATIYVYGLIGGWWGDIDAQTLNDQLKEIDAKTIHLRVNSPGGDVFEARAMMTAIRQHKAKVIGHVDGLAASAATFLLMSSDEIEITQGGFFMIHNAWTVAMGNKGDLRSTADLLDKIDGTIVNDYASRATASREDIVGWMEGETWFTADEAMEHGFVDRVAEVAGKGDDTASARASAWNLAAYANAPKALTERAPPSTEPDTTDADIAAHRAHMERRFALLEAEPA